MDRQFSEEHRYRSSPPVYAHAAVVQARGHSLVVFCFGVCEDVRLQVGRLRKFFAAAVKGAHVRAVSSVDTNMCAQVKVQREPLATALKRALQTEDKESRNWYETARGFSTAESSLTWKGFSPV